MNPFAQTMNALLLSAALTAPMLRDEAFAGEVDGPPERTVRVAGIVLKWVRTDKEANFRRIEPLIREAAAKGAQIVCTTECFLDGYAAADKSIPLENYRKLGEPIPTGKYYQQLANLSKELKIHLAAGMTEAEGDKSYNTAVLIGPDGKLIGKYRKQKLLHETDRNTPGDVSSVFATSCGRVGIMICSDRTDPNIVRSYCRNRADFLLCLSGGSFGKGNDQIVAARSYENSIPIVFVHPAEFLATGPTGSVEAQAIVGTDMSISPEEAGGEKDQNRVFLFDLPPARGPVPADNAGTAVQTLLAREIIGARQTMIEVLNYCEQLLAPMPQPATAAEWEQYAKRLRADILNNVVFRGKAADWRAAPTRVEWLAAIPGGPGYRIKKLRYEALPGLWIPAWLYEPEHLRGQVPVYLCFSGHDGNVPHKQILCANLAKRGILALNVEWVGTGQLQGPGYRHTVMNQLDLCGASGLAPFYLSMERALDLALKLPNADAQRVAASGYSGGGWQTILLGALDPRVRLVNPVAGFGSFGHRIQHPNDLGDSEQQPCDLATLADYTHLTALMAPRPTLLTYCAKDECCWQARYALPRIRDAAAPIFKLLGEEKALRSHVNDNPGTHNYERENREQFYRMIGDFFYPGRQTFPYSETPCQDEVKTKEQLAVELPAQNAGFNSLALTLSSELPRAADPPQEKAAILRWQQGRKTRLYEVVRAKDFAVQPVQTACAEQGGLRSAFWKLHLGGRWTVPVVELASGQPKATAILVHDGGRRSEPSRAEQLLASGCRVLALDPFLFGESAIDALEDCQSYQFALLLSAVGDRPLGLQASQLAAVARWSLAAHQHPATVVAVGPRSSACALAAAALEDKAISQLELHGCLGTLKEVIERNHNVAEMPEMFCFGLLEEFDIKQLAALIAPRPVALMRASPRAKKELGELKGWYAALGSDFEPIR